jgi:hypothetical protein
MNGFFLILDSSGIIHENNNIQTQKGTGVDNGGNGGESGWVTLSGTVSYNGNPVCALVLANGQHMFSCKDVI